VAREGDASDGGAGYIAPRTTIRVVAREGAGWVKPRAEALRPPLPRVRPHRASRAPRRSHDHGASRWGPWGILARADSVEGSRFLSPGARPG